MIIPDFSTNVANETAEEDWLARYIVPFFLRSAPLCHDAAYANLRMPILTTGSQNEYLEPEALVKKAILKYAALACFIAGCVFSACEAKK